MADAHGKYKKIILHKQAFIILLFIAMILCFCMDLVTGASNLSVGEIINILFHPDSVPSKTYTIVWVIRMPVAIMAILVGAGLSVSGMEMQTILNNSLASPYTLGISSAASFGAALSLVLGYIFLPENLQNFVTPIFAFAFSLGASLIIFYVSKLKRDRSAIILSGIAVNFLFTALNSIFTFFVSDDVLRGITNWSYGTLIGAKMDECLIVFTVLCVCVPLLFRESWKLTSLSMGDSTAKALGVNVERLRTKILVLVSMITAISVCFVGTIGFIGLVAPYIAKRGVGEDQRFRVPASLMFGALLLSLSSLMSKMNFFGIYLPISLITSLIGIPFLLLLILEKKS